MSKGKYNVVHYIINIIAIVVLVSLVLGVIRFKESGARFPFQDRVERFIDEAKRFMGVKKKNIEIEIAPERRAPLTLIDKEAKLRLFVPHLFGDFTEADWKEFWAVIYDPIEEKQGLLKAKRFRTRDEIEAYFEDKYPDPFTYFQPQHWNYFWSVVGGR